MLTLFTLPVQSMCALKLLKSNHGAASALRYAILKRECGRKVALTCSLHCRTGRRPTQATLKKPMPPQKATAPKAPGNGGQILCWPESHVDIVGVLVSTDSSNLQTS